MRLRRWLVLKMVLVVGGFIMLLPELWVLVNSFEPSRMQFTLPPVWFTSHLTLASYRQLFDLIPFLMQLANSVAVTHGCGRFFRGERAGRVHVRPLGVLGPRRPVRRSTVRLDAPDPGSPRRSPSSSR